MDLSPSKQPRGEDQPRLFSFDNSYARLPEPFYKRCDPTPVQAPKLIEFNGPLADQLGLNREDGSDELLARVFSGNQLMAGSEPIATAYSGHQFGTFNPTLGDGRAILLGEVIDLDNHRRDIQLKGSGRTPYSRGGDGRAPIGPVLREYILSEAMHALGVPTTRALAAVASGERVIRDFPEPGAVLTRVAKAHIRVGTFQYFAARGDQGNLHRLADYAISRTDPLLMAEEEPYLAFLKKVIDRQAGLIAKWMNLGFIHGVINTDNMAISGETLDYGPCAFLDFYQPDKAFSAVDVGSRYAFGNQPMIGQWNLARFAEAILPLLDEDQDAAVDKATQAVRGFLPLYEDYWLAGMRAKLGLSLAEPDDKDLAERLLAIMADNRSDFTSAFRALANHQAGKTAAAQAEFGTSDAVAAWFSDWQERLDRESEPAQDQAARMFAVNPRVIPRNHRVEKAIREARDDDYTEFHRLLAAVREPYGEQPDTREYETPPSEQEEVLRTFCGT
ncbi:MAG: YdiU family protein [Oleiphilaceae bacterium]|nr:YdiU family protein [Oleiphilaceae bacterium]